jgi:hypothetical protein
MATEDEVVESDSRFESMMSLRVLLPDRRRIEEAGGGYGIAHKTDHVQ